MYKSPRRRYVRPGIGSLAASAVQQAQLTVSGGTISAGQSNCGTGANGVLLRDAARFTMNNGATFTNLMGTVVEIHETAKATLSKLAKIQRDFTGFAGCNPQGGVSAFDSTTLSLQNAQIVSTNGGKNAVGIFWGSRGSVSLDSSVIKGQTFGLYGPGNVKLVASNTVFQFNFFGIDVDGPSPKIIILKSTVSNNAVGIRATGLLVRRTLITSNQQTGVLLTGGSGNDLGVVADLGVNLIAANGITGVGFDPKVTGGGVILAVGNSWNPVTQGTDGSGHYPVMTVLGTSTNPPVVGKNFFLPATADFRIGL
jgi:hypothetical protein